MTSDSRLTIIEPDGRASSRPIFGAPSLAELQAGVGGLIQLIPGLIWWDEHRCVAFVNEEGKINGLPVNLAATMIWAKSLARTGNPRLEDHLVGPVVIVTGSQEFLAAL